MADRTFDKEALLDLSGGDAHEGFKLVSDTIEGTDRWTTNHRMVFKFEGKFWVSHYSVGSTESQDQQAYEYDDPVAYEAQAVEKTITVYERID